MRLSILGTALLARIVRDVRLTSIATLLDVSIAQTAVIHPLHNHAHNAFERKARCFPANARLTGDATPPRAA
jgi:hypothetical protein